MSDSTEYKEKLVDSVEIPAPDELIARGDYITSSITLPAGEYHRGMLLMSGEGGFVVSTADGVNSASELCILCDDITVPEGETATAAGYFWGTFAGSSVVIPYEGEDSNHEEVLAGLLSTLRKHGIYIV